MAVDILFPSVCVGGAVVALYVILCNVTPYFSSKGASKKHPKAVKPRPMSRVVRFRPVIEGNKFERRTARCSLHMEQAAESMMISAARENVESAAVKDVRQDFAFLVRNVLTAEECDQLIKAAENTGFEQRKYSGKGDDSSSCCFASDMLANDVIFRRIKHLLPERSYFDADSSLTLNDLNYYSSGDRQKIECFGSLECLNTSCRVEKYKKGEHLKIHRDGCVLVPNTTDTFTVYAILIYLNKEFTKGETRFCVDVDPYPKQGNFPYTFLDVKGNVGDALIFRHEILHKGGSVADGTKYILRLDVAYKLEQ